MSYSNRLTRRSMRTCRSCGRCFNSNECLSVADSLCLICLFGRNDHQHGGDDNGRRLFEAIAERVRIGTRLRNDRAVDYPAGLDYRLTRLLDALRHYVVRVRITSISDRLDGDAFQVVQGHLRRYGPLDEEADDFGLKGDLLGLFLNVGDYEPTACVDDDDFCRIVRIDVIDGLLLGDRDPVVCWKAPAAMLESHVARREGLLCRERRRAKLFVMHVLLVLSVWIGLLIPVVVAIAAGEHWTALGWVANFVVIGFVVGMTLPIWEPIPDLSVLRKSGHWGD